MSAPTPKSKIYVVRDHDGFMHQVIAKTRREAVVKIAIEMTWDDLNRVELVNYWSVSNGKEMI